METENERWICNCRGAFFRNMAELVSMAFLVGSPEFTASVDASQPDRRDDIVRLIVTGRPRPIFSLPNAAPRQKTSDAKERELSIN